MLVSMTHWQVTSVVTVSVCSVAMTTKLLHIRKCPHHVSVQKDSCVMQQHWTPSCRISSPGDCTAPKPYST